jgi:ribosomal-protein-alanine N-acetyltransferase
VSEPVLRPWTVDAAALCAASAASPDLRRQVGDADLTSTDGARRFIEQTLVVSATRRNWAIAVDGVAVGNVGASAIERRHDTAWMSYWLSTAARHRGLATLALASAAEWAFDAGLFRLELGHRVDNPASCSVASRAGFSAEGIERQKLSYGDERFDVELHARLATDAVPDHGRLAVVS